MDRKANCEITMSGVDLTGQPTNGAETMKIITVDFADSSEVEVKILRDGANSTSPVSGKNGDAPLQVLTDVQNGAEHNETASGKLTVHFVQPRSSSVRNTLRSGV